MLARAWARDPLSGPTEEDLRLLEEKVAVRSVMHGVPGSGTPDTGPTMMEIFRVNGGRIAELWGISGLPRQGK